MAVHTLRSVALLAVFLAVLVPAAGAVTWTIEEAKVYPHDSANESEGVVVAKVVDDDGDPVHPDHCSVVDVTYDYDGTTIDVRMVPAKTRGWFYNDTLVFNSSGTSLDVIANGNCDGQQTTSSVSQTVTFDPTGNISVSFLTSFDAEGYIAENNLSVTWNATNHTGDFEPHANLTYGFYDEQGNLDASGTEVAGDITQNADNYTAEFTLPQSKGRYTLVINASNTSLTYLDPWGGAARTVNVLPRLSGNADLRNVDGCESTAPLECEKGAELNILFEEVTGNASAVNATFYGEDGNVTTVQLSEKNDTYWNTTYTLPEGFNTSAHGWDLNVTLNATDGEVYASDNATLQVQNFTVIESTQPFVGRGNAIEIVVGPVTPLRELPVPESNVSEVNLTIRNTTGNIVGDASLTAPFDSDEYDDDRQLFTYSWPVATNADTGEYEVTAEVTDVFGVEKTLAFNFDVLEDGTVGPVVEIAGAGGQTGVNELNKTYNTTGNKTVTVLLNNTADVPALVDVFFEGDLDGIAELDADEPISFSAEQLKTVRINVTLSEAQSYVGDIKFLVHGSFVTDYNLTLPTNLTATNACSELNGTLCVSDTDLEKTIRSAGDHNLTLTVQNGEDADLTVVSEGNITTFLEEITVALTGGESEDVELPFTVGSGDSGTYTGNVTLSTDDASISLPAELVINTTSGSISASVSPGDLGTYVAGEAVPFDLTVNNTGNTSVSGLTITASQVDVDTTDDVTLEPGNGTTLSLTGTAPDLDGEVSVSVQVRTGGGVSTTASASLTSFRDYAARFTQLDTELGLLEDRLANVTTSEENRTSIQEDLDSMETLIQEGQTAWDQGDYSTARTRYQEADQLRQSADQALTTIENAADDDGGGGGPGLPIIPIVVFLVIVGIVGVIVYLSIVPEESEQESGFETYY